MILIVEASKDRTLSLDVNYLLNGTPIEMKDFELIRSSVGFCDRTGPGLHQSMVQVPPKSAGNVES